MCGICGIVARPGQRSPDREVLSAMNQVLVHRGPDSGGVYVDGPAGLGARRLAIIDVAGGSQPMVSEDGSVCVVQNGEIYNHRALREELEGRGHRFRTRCDTEVLLELYREHGPSFVHLLRGMFALAVWDRRAQRLVLARDRFGIKPLYFSVGADGLSFASELKALLRLPGFSRDPDAEAISCFLAFNSIPAPHTIYRQARKLGAGELLTWEGGRVRTERFARPAPAGSGELRREPGPELAQELRERLRDSVRAHLVADVPVGVLLSGGIDSSALTALAASETSGRLATFSIGFAERSFNELDRARLVARRYDTDHHELVVSPSAADLLPELASSFDEPFADSSAIPTYLVSRLASEHVKVALSGEGGDELFGGYETYVADLIAERAGGALARLRPLVELLPSSSARVSVDYRAKRFVRAADRPALDRHHGWKEIFSDAARAELLVDPYRSDVDPLASYRTRFAETEGAPLLARLQDVDLGIYLVDDLLVKTDRMSMAHSLEVRVPFLDPAVADLALALPTSQKIRGLSKKRLLRRAVAPLLPRAIVRGRKRGFSIPAAAWLRGELAPFAREVLSVQRCASQGFFNPQAVQRVLEDHVAGREDYSRQLWGLISFSLWADQLQTADDPAPPQAPQSQPAAAR
ncbi:MAG TPA: asparagine synthase (glutamine-hydrolyzing) [Solirubrobacteraceae bacterium]|nr:asparagine synthase (glutamine-hydrolyzing) [Solirubrobacteraceae bacterium]